MISPSSYSYFFVSLYLPRSVSKFTVNCEIQYNDNIRGSNHNNWLGERLLMFMEDLFAPDNDFWRLQSCC